MLEMGPGPAHLIFLELMAGGGDMGQVPAAGWVSQHSNRGLSGMGQAHLTSAWGGGGWKWDSGAFIAGVPVQPVLIRYPNSLVSLSLRMEGGVHKSTLNGNQ